MRALRLLDARALRPLLDTGRVERRRSADAPCVGAVTLGTRGCEFEFGSLDRRRQYDQ